MKYGDFEHHIKKSLQQNIAPVDINDLLSKINLQSTSVEEQNVPHKKYYMLILLFLFMAFGVIWITSKPNGPSKIEETIKNSGYLNQSQVLKDKNTESYEHVNPETEIDALIIQESEEFKYLSAPKSITNKRVIVENLSADKKTKFDFPSSSSSKSGISYEIDKNEFIINQHHSELQSSTSNFLDSGQDFETASIKNIQNRVPNAESLPYISSEIASLNQSPGKMGPGSSKISCPTFSRKTRLTFSLIPEIGYFKPLKTLSNVSTEPSEVLNLRNENEKSLEGLQAALYGRISLKGIPFYIQTGLNYNRIAERMDLSYNFVRQDTVQGIISITKSPSGDTITTIYGDIIRETTVSGQTTAHHYFQLLDIPVSMGYEKNLGRFEVGIEAGAMFNIYMKSTGRVLNSPSGFQEIETINPYKTNIGLSYFGSANISTPLGIGKINLALRYRHIPTNFALTSSLIAQNYNQLGLHLGYIIPIL